MAEARLPKPQLRDLHLTYVRKSLIGLLITSVTSLIGYKVLITDPHAKKIEDFYKGYDPHKALEAMNASGFMDSAPQ